MPKIKPQARTSCFKLLFAALLGSLLPAALCAGNWTASSMAPSPDVNQAPAPSPPANGTNVPIINNYTGTGDCVGTGTGVLISGTDVNTFELYVPASDVSGSTTMLQVTLTSPIPSSPYWLDVDPWDPGTAAWTFAGVGSTVNGVQTVNYSLASSTFPQYIVIQVGVGTAGNFSANPYTLNIAIVGAGTISGQISAAGVGASGLSGFEVWATDGNDDDYRASAFTDAAGNYSIQVPLNVAIQSLYAVRYWTSEGEPLDQAYGPTRFDLSPNIDFSSGGTLSGVNFTAYPEAVLTGTYSGTSTPPSGWYVSRVSEYEMEMEQNEADPDIKIDPATPAGTYAFHNVQPGTWHVFVAPQDGVNAVNIFDNVIVADGLQSSLPPMNFTPGASLTVNFNPAPLANVVVYFFLHDSGGAFINAMNVQSGASSATMSGLPANMGYDVKVYYSGLPVFFEGSNFTVGAGGTTSSGNLTGLTLSDEISGTVTDGLGVGFSNMLVVAFPHGTNPLDGSAPVSDVPVNPDGTYSVPVDPTWLWDVLLVSNGPSGIVSYSGLASVAGNSTNQNLFTAAGNPLSGGLLISAAAPAPEQMFAIANYQDSDNAVADAFSTPGGNFIADWSLQSAFTGAFTLGNLLDGTYNLSVACPYMKNQLPLTSVTMAGAAQSGQTANIKVDPNQDFFTPWACDLIPASLEGVTQTVYSTTPLIQCTLHDGILGTGVFPPTFANVEFDLEGRGTRIANFMYNTATGQLSCQPSLPLLQGLTHTVSVQFNDQANSPNTGQQMWAFYIPAVIPTPTPSLTVSATQSQTFTPSPVVTATCSATPSATPTSSFTVSPTPTPSGTNPPTATPTVTPSATQTATPVGSASPATATGTLGILGVVSVPLPYSLSTGQAGSAPYLKVELGGYCDQFTVKIFTANMVLAGQQTFAGSQTVWSSLPMAGLFNALTPGLYFAWVEAGRNGGSTVHARSTFVILP